MTPLVSFVVPCYRLGHYLAECVNSILNQTYQNLEVLIMDDCSPDNTPEIGQSFGDPRVRYIRNEPNLGHLRNYNKGIELARGKYVWLISADDVLRSANVLMRYVSVLEANPRVGYVFCPAVRLEDGIEGQVLEYSVHSAKDCIFPGRRFIRKLIQSNTIVAPTVLARKSCYENVSLFPLSMPWGGDWYLWFVFALYHDVAYFSEPMVCYRRHCGSMTNKLTTESVERCSSEDVEMPWIMRRKLEEAGFSYLSKECLRSAAAEYARSLASKSYKTATSITEARMTFENFEASLNQNCVKPQERTWVRARVHAALGDRRRWAGERALARRSYVQALAADFLMPRVWVKLLLVVSAGGPARRLLLGLMAFRRVFAGTGASR